ncbi:hypothetical protein EK21DRAFT_89178 [Setomelanomma holmii]|uniref:Uncharacterized protein n=1 Tax=Setomelanomma holmii TaxID=210430 RepID=A0A9P4HBJ8_9PLEO|nr:hypothetical protein EK21DRAFT_89178 [Setomelanomma holmii]
MASQTPVEPLPDGTIPKESVLASNDEDRNLDHRKIASPAGQIDTPVQNPSSFPIREQRQLACPLFLHEQLSDMPHSCNGVAAQTMSDVRRHLIRPHRGGKSHLELLKRCPTCKEDMMDHHEFNIAHWERGEFCNHPQKQRRGLDARLVEWVKLYRVLLPTADKVPSPYAVRMNWLPEEVSALSEYFVDGKIFGLSLIGLERNASDGKVSSLVSQEKSKRRQDVTYVGMAYQPTVEHAIMSRSPANDIDVGGDDAETNTYQIVVDEQNRRAIVTEPVSTKSSKTENCRSRTTTSQSTGERQSSTTRGTWTLVTTRT